MSSTPKLTFVFYVSLLIFFLSMTFFAVTSPVALQKILSLKVIDKSLPIYSDYFYQSELEEISELIKNIPYKNDAATSSWFVHPREKYKDTIMEGNGNCSNLAFGAMYKLIADKKRAVIIHLLQTDLGFLNGAGHTAIQIDIGEKEIIVDVLEGGLPLQNEKLINALKFELNDSDVFTHRVLSDYKDDKNFYFSKEYLSQIQFGVIPQKEIEEYFYFLELIYVPLGSTYFEKLFFDTVALFFGKYPNTYVSEDLEQRILDNAVFSYIFAFGSLISFHLSYLFGSLILLRNLMRRTFRNT